LSDQPFEDYYEYLQISPNADSETIERIYRLLAKKYHPDNQETGSADKFDIITKAHNILSDPEKRAAYDVRYEKAKSQEWRTVSDLSPSGGHASDAHIRRTVLSILYIDRRENPSNPGVGNWQLEKFIGLPEKTIDFHIWYLKEKKWIALTDSGGYAITAKGVDEIESDGLIIGKDLLLTDSDTADGEDPAVGFIEETTPSRVTAYEKAIRSLERKLTINPANIAALVGLTYFNNRLGRSAEAVRSAQQIRHINPAFTVSDFENTLKCKFQRRSLRNTALLNQAGIY
jgi:curved DNA-binding protein CbpA